MSLTSIKLLKVVAVTFEDAPVNLVVVYVEDLVVVALAVVTIVFSEY